MSQRKGRIAAVVTIAAVGVLATGSQAVGVNQPEAPLATNVARDSITSYHIGSYGISQQNDLSVPLQNLLRTPKANSVSSWNLTDNGVAEQDLTAAVRTKLNKAGQQGPKGDKGDTGEKGEAASDVLGGGAVKKEVGPTAIVNIGGSFAARKTELGTFTLPKGTWLINAAVVFDRLNVGDGDYQTPTTDTYPQFAIRYGESPGNFGTDAGTVMGTAISRAGRVELTGSGVKVVTVTDDTTVSLYGFGYNEDQSGFGGGQIKVAAQVSATKIG